MSMMLLFFTLIATKVVHCALAQNHVTDELFMPLSCNDALADTSCVNFSSLNINPNDETLEIPCGKCVVMDYEEDNLTLSKGLNIVGKLVFPSTRKKLTITTSFVFVQGELIIEELSSAESGDKIPQMGKLLHFHFVGTGTVTFTSHPSQSYDKCQTGCDVSKKPFVVAGGSLNIRGMSESCSTWKRLQSAVDAGPAVLVTNPLLGDGDNHDDDNVPRQGCSFILVQESKEPEVYLPVSCIIPNERYLLRFRYRYRHSSSNDALFSVPYVKMIRYPTAPGESAQWINTNAVYSRGSITTVPTNEWQDLQMVITFDDVMADPNQTGDLLLYIAPFSDVDNMEIDDFNIESAIPFHNDLREVQSCDNLLLNGRADIFVDGRHTYPFYPTGGVLNVVPFDDESENHSIIPTEESLSGKYFFRNSLRLSRYVSVLSQDISTDCLAKAGIYEFSAFFRVNSQSEDDITVHVTLEISPGEEYTIVDCPVSSNNEWISCSGNFQMTEEQAVATSARLMTYLSDDTSTIDIFDVSLLYQGGRTIQLILENEGSHTHDCWGEDAEILVTSHTIRHQDSQVAKIKSVDPNTGIITLQEPIHKPITLDDDTNTGVEVALLSRNILFTAADDDTGNPLDGGHMIIMHTSAPITQTIVGVESHNFGQQGKLGRYPFHFHMCGSVAGSTLSKNSVRNTKQRGIVVHGTNNLKLEENILHDIKGHAVLLEDGGEQGNTFLKNLGAVTNPVEIRISDQESDTNPATFWMTNPQNTWISNVAAGSDFSGFWFEVSNHVRGPSAAKFPDMVPNKLDLGTFTDNVSHSNAQGLQTYPQSGYRPEKLAVFKNHKSFRNRKSGVFFHAGGRLSIDGGYLSDNKIGVDIDMDHSDVISNTVIIGSSTIYDEVVKSLGYKASQWPPATLCHSSDDSLVGVRLDSYHSGSLFGATGSSLSNVKFSGFNSGKCAGSSVIHVDSDDIQYFDTRNRLKNIDIIDDSPKINLCGAEKQVAIRDEDGSFMGKSGFFISDTNAIRAHPDCISHSESCSAFCPQICLRTMTVFVPSFYERGSLTLEITGTIMDGRPITPVIIQDFQTKDLEFPKKSDAQGRFFVTLPAGGKYHGKFSINNQPVWPHYADLQYEDKTNNCGPNFESFTIDQLSQLLDPSPDDLIINGNFEADTDFWWYLAHQGMKIMQEGANGSSKSLLVPNTAADGGGRHGGLGQYLDTRYIEAGYVYTLTAFVKLTDSTTGEIFQCDLESNLCPGAGLKITNLLEDPGNFWRNLGTMQENDKEWNIMTGSYTSNTVDAAANSVLFYINGAPANVDIQISKVSLVRNRITMAPSMTPTKFPTNSPTVPPIIIPTNEPTETPTKAPAPPPGDCKTVFFVENFEDGWGEFDSGGSNAKLVDNRKKSGNWSVRLRKSGRLKTPLKEVFDSDELKIYFWFFSIGMQDGDKIHLDVKFAGDVNEWVPTASYAIGIDFSNGEWTEKSVSFPRLKNEVQFRFRGDGNNIAGKLFFDDIIFCGLTVGTATEFPGVSTPPPTPFVTSSQPSAASTSDSTIFLFETSNTESIIVHEEIIEFETTSGLDSTVLSRLPHNGAGTEYELEFIVHLLDREISDGGYQPQLVLFFAPEETSIDQLTTNDNGFTNYFETSVIAWMKEKVYCCSDATYFNVMSLVTDETGTLSKMTGNEAVNKKMVSGSALRLKRSSGKISSFYSFDNGDSWTQFGLEYELPAEFQTAPLKVGYRIKREWHSSYHMTTSPLIISGGEVESITEAPAHQPYFGSVTLSSSTDVQTIVLSKDAVEVFEGDVSLTVKVDERLFFGTGYQAGLWLFFATEDTSTEEIISTTGNNDFKDIVVAAVGDKIHYNCCEHTWTYKSSYTKNEGRKEDNGGDTYKNMNGYLKLQRIGGAIQAWMSSDGNNWIEVGSRQILPDNFAVSPLKVGLRIFTNWAPGYFIEASVDLE